VASILACGIAALAAAPPAGAVDLLDGRLHVNGSIEEQIRGLSRNFEENLDLAQWYTVLGVEIDAELLPDGWGPFSSMSAFSRLEVRYDCVWTRACGLARSADTFGDRARKVPPRLGEARIGGYAGAAFTGDRRRRMGIPIDLLGFQYKDTTDGNRNVGDTGLWNVPSVDTLFGVKGALQNDPVDDPALYTFRNFLDYRFALRHIDGVENGHGTQVMGPWLPKNGIDSVGTTADIVNPFNAAERNPITGIQGSTALPYRPPPRFAADSGVALTEARGLYYPSAGLRRLVADDVLDDPDQEFRQNQLAWNRGASQKDTAELKEIYLDVGFLEDRLFFRIGKQNIVWGKTELFRTTDQFNPQDLALATLPSLEESRIALWAFRAFYSFYEVGPLSDVRLEVATNFDHYEPNDLGRCGEPYAPNPVCDKTFGLFAHGLVGLGVSGEKRPDDPWKSVEGYEVGARLEFRWDRYSFAITDYWGFDDFPYIDKYWTFERNVDPTSGRPRKARATGPCVNGNEPACLGPNDALTEHHANLQYFALICSSSVGFSDLDRSVCAQSVFNSQADALGDTVAHRISTLLGGGFVLPGPINTANIILNGLSGTTGFPVVLNTDPADGPGTVLGGVSSRLTAQQEALLGCGPFYGQSATGCDDLGIDLLNAEASALIQSFVGFQGAGGVGWLTNDASVAQPGTIGFAGGPVCTRHMNGVTYVLPGCRGPGDAGYDPAIDGTNTGLTNLAGQPFRSEMAALSFNFQNLLVAFSSPAVPGQPQINEFDSTQPLRTNGCSYAAPQFCSNVQAIFAIVGSQRNSVLAGGNGTYGRTDFVWHGGSPNLLRYDKRNVLGFSMDFAEDTSATNWSVEATWIAQTRYADNDVARGYRDVDEYNLTISVDRPTFINFLNTGRTFFFNSQWFFQYVNGYRKSFPSNGPFNVLATFTIQTGYFQDRLLPGVTFVYDFESNSGAILPELQYRVTESLSLTIGMAGFWGRTQEKVFPFSPSGLDNHVGKSSYHAFAENGLAAVRDKDEIFFKFRWTF
jgi:hypothetical protein